MELYTTLLTCTTSYCTKKKINMFGITIHHKEQNNNQIHNWHRPDFITTKMWPVPADVWQWDPCSSKFNSLRSGPSGREEPTTTLR